MADVDAKINMDMLLCSPRNLDNTKLKCDLCNNTEVITCYYAGPCISKMSASFDNIGYIVCENKECRAIIKTRIETFTAACNALGLAGLARIDGKIVKLSEALQWARICRHLALEDENIT